MTGIFLRIFLPLLWFQCAWTSCLYKLVLKDSSEAWLLGKLAGGGYSMSSTPEPLQGHLLVNFTGDCDDEDSLDPNSGNVSFKMVNYVDNSSYANIPQLYAPLMTAEVSSGGLELARLNVTRTLLSMTTNQSSNMSGDGNKNAFDFTFGTSFTHAHQVEFTFVPVTGEAWTSNMTGAIMDADPFTGKYFLLRDDLGNLTGFSMIVPNLAVDTGMFKNDPNSSLFLGLYLSATYTLGCSSTCQQHGHCSRSSGAPKCVCQCGWSGIHCDTPPSSSGQIELVLPEKGPLESSTVQLVGEGLAELHKQSWVPYFEDYECKDVKVLSPSRLQCTRPTIKYPWKMLAHMRESKHDDRLYCHIGDYPKKNYEAMKLMDWKMDEADNFKSLMPSCVEKFKEDLKAEQKQITANCSDGLAGYDCKRCLKDDVCREGDDRDSYMCEKSGMYTYKATKNYYCTGTGDMSIFGDIIIKVACSPVHGNCSVSVLLNEQVLLGCTTSKCEMFGGSASFKCAETKCGCAAEDECDQTLGSLVKSVVGEMSFDCKKNGTYTDCAVDNDNLPFALTAQCQIGDCIDENAEKMPLYVEEAPPLSPFIITVITLSTLFFVTCPLGCICQLWNTRACGRPKRKNRKNPGGKNGKLTSINGDDDDGNEMLVGRYSSNKKTKDIDKGDDIVIKQNTKYLKFTEVSLLIDTRFNIIPAICRFGQQKVAPDDLPKGCIQALNKVSGKCPSGKLTAIMGHSGAGKSSLLRLLAGLRPPTASRVSGEVLWGGKRRDQRWSRICGYVAQECILMSTMTVSETVTFSARLLLSPEMSSADVNERVLKCLTDLRLIHRANTRVGDNTDGSGGISGGERRRLTIAQEIVAEPQCLLLDEPTSGLDSWNAKNTIEILQSIAETRNCVVIMTLHQPRQEVFAMLDTLMVMQGGRMVYADKRSSAKAAFERAGPHFVCPESTAFADFLLDCLSMAEEDGHTFSKVPAIKAEGEQEDKEDTNNNNNDNNNNNNNNNNNDKEGDDEIPPNKKARQCPICVSTDAPPFSYQLLILLQRGGLHLWRSPGLLRLHMFLAIGLGVMLGAAFYGVAGDLGGFQNRLGALFFILCVFSFSALSSMDLFVRERELFIKETRGGYYKMPAFFLAKSVVDIVPLRVIPALLFSLIFASLMGLRDDPNRLIIFCACIIMTDIVAGALCVAIAAVFSSVAMGTLFGSLFILVNALFSGLLLNIESTQGWMRWLRDLSFFAYGYEALMVNELSGLTIAFDPNGLQGLNIKGDLFLDALSLDKNAVAYDLSMLAVFCVAYMAIGFIFMTLRALRQKRGRALI